MSFTVYKSSDPDAPQFPNLKEIWKACLFTGYGSGADAKAPAGWTMPFEDSLKAVFKPAPSPQNEKDKFVRISSAGGTSGDLNIYDSMTDIDNGSNLFNAKQLIAIGKWIIIASDSWAWFIVTTPNTDCARPVFFGNITPILPEQKKRFCIVNPQHYTSDSGKSRSLFLGGKRNVSLFTAFDADNYNTMTSGDLVWADIAVSDASGILGVLPILKATPLNAQLPTEAAIGSGSGFYALKVGLNRRGAQMIMDLRDV